MPEGSRPGARDLSSRTPDRAQIPGSGPGLYALQHGYVPHEVSERFQTRFVDGYECG